MCETHAGIDKEVVDFSRAYDGVAAYLSHLALMFHHLEYFSRPNVVNLDIFSLTDAFPKVFKPLFFRSVD